jgi:hypothetical protein
MLYIQVFTLFNLSTNHHRHQHHHNVAIMELGHFTRYGLAQPEVPSNFTPAINLPFGV